LIVSALTLAHGGERHRHQRGALFHYIARPVEPRHALGHPGGNGAPAAVLQRVHDRRARAARDPADRARRAHEWREELGPLALVVGQRVVAALAARVAQLVEAGPAAPADGSLITRVEKPPARYAGTRKKEIQERRAHL